MTPQSMINKMFWIGLFSWMFSGTAKAQCVHSAGAGGAFTVFQVPTQGDLLVFGLTVLLLWGFTAWMMNRFFPYGRVLDSVTTMQNDELSFLQAKTDSALHEVETEYEEMILNRMDQVTDNKTSHEEAKEFRSQRAASV